MNALVSWLTKHKIPNPHLIPEKFPHLEQEYKVLFGDETVIWPQPGGQELFQDCPADIMLYGGEAGAGKSWSLVYDHCKWVHIPTYRGVIARKEFAQIFDSNGLWDISNEIYPHFGGVPVKSGKPYFRFPSGARVTFKHSQHEAKVEHYWQGGASAVIGLDELTQFSKKEFLYAMSRNRSTTGIASYMRATCNPDPESFVRKMIDWWIDEEGFVINERSGIIRYFVHRDDQFVWADDPQDLIDKFGPKTKPKSFTFIRGNLKDNRMLLSKDPDYEASMDNLTDEQKHALKGGNWNHIENPDALFTRRDINDNRVESVDLANLARVVIAIDPAGSTHSKSDDTGLVAVGCDADDHVFVLEDDTGKYQPNDWAARAIDLYDRYQADKIVGEANYGGDMVVNTVSTYARTQGRTIVPQKVTASRGKHVRAEPVSTLYKQGKVHHVGHRFKQLESQMTNFDPKKENQRSPNNMDALVWGVTELGVILPKRVPRFF